MRHTEIENKIDDFTKEEYRFCLLDSTLLLDSYHLMKRETKRHKFKVYKKYERLSSNRARYEKTSINKDDVPFTDVIKQLAMDEFIKNITVALSFR